MIKSLSDLQIKNILAALIVFLATFSSVNLLFNKLDFFINKRGNNQSTNPEKLVYWTYEKDIVPGRLKHVHTVLDRLGYENDTENSNWNLLWAHDYPFLDISKNLQKLKPHQKVNHFSGIGCITNKVELSTTGFEYTPKAFKLPNQKNELIEYVQLNPGKLFVQKGTTHRGVKLQNIENIDFDSKDIFVQEYVEKPFLVDGHKFDFGVYTIITSVDPLRVYIYNGDVLFRYCQEKYYPLDPENKAKYVSGGNYLPTWKVPSLKYYYSKLGFSMRDSFNAYVRSKGQDPTQMWHKVEDIIRQVILNKEDCLVNNLKRFKSKRNFFEMMRIDFIIDENLNVYLMEANMSPNLSSAHFASNSLLYEQVLYNLFSLIGLAERVKKTSLAIKSNEEELMLTADKNLAVFPEECSSEMCMKSCLSPVCQICKTCLNSNTRKYLIQAYREHNRQDCKRIFPPKMNQESVNTSSMDLKMYSTENQLQYRWFIGKCLLDSDWC